MKKCPACRLELTTLLLSENILIDYCKRCKGSWFDAKELKSAHKEDPVLQSIVATTKLETTEITCSACGSANKRGAARCTVCEAGLRMECPVCEKPLQEKLIGKLAIDRCEKCRGVWLDGGELTSLFQEFSRVVQLQQKAKTSGSDVAGDLAALSLDAMIWAPDLVFYAATALAELAKRAPDALEAVGKLPDVAAAGAEVSTKVVEGAMEALSHAPEAAGAVMEFFKHFIEAILDLLND